MNELFEFVKNTLQYRGEVVEQDNGGLNALLSPHIAGKLELPEYVEFVPDIESKPNGVLLSYGSEVLDRFVSLIGNEGATTRFVYPAELVKELTRRDIERVFQFSGCKLRKVSAHEGYVPYIQFNFKYTIISDERRDGFFECLLNQVTMSRADPIEDKHLLRPIKSRGEIRGDILSGKPPEKVYERACKIVEGAIIEETVDFRKSLNRRLGRDLKRIDEYYGKLLTELKKRQNRRKTSGMTPEEYKGKQRAINMEMQSKKLDMINKYETTIDVKLVNAAIIFIPCVVGEIEVLQRKNRINLQIPWNPIIKSLEPLVCEGCLSETFSIYLCPEMHLLCENCHTSCITCGRKYCRVCHGDSLPCGHDFV